MDAVTSEFVRNAGNVVLGWALGLGSAAFSDWRKGRRRAKAVKVAIACELRETAYRLLMLVYKLGGRHGAWDRELLKWMQSEIDRYGGLNPKDGFTAGVAGFLKQTDEELRQVSIHLQKTTPSQFIPAEELPYTQGAVGELHDQKPDYSVRVLDILAHLRMFNETRENGVYHTRLTFTSGLSDDSYANARQGVKSSEVQMVRRARIIVDKITALDAKFPQ